MLVFWCESQGSVLSVGCVQYTLHVIVFLKSDHHAHVAECLKGWLEVHVLKCKLLPKDLVLLYDVVRGIEFTHEFWEFLVRVVVKLLSDSALSVHWNVEIQLSHMDLLWVRRESSLTFDLLAWFIHSAFIICILGYLGYCPWNLLFRIEDVIQVETLGF